MGKKLIIVIGIIVFLFSCNSEIEPTDKPNKPKPNEIVQVITPTFNPDSAYQFIQNQVDFGPRVPNSKEHDNCAVWLENKLKGYGAKTLVQEGEVTAFNGDKLQIKNIIGQFSPKKTSRILLFAHWDTRPVADKDTKDKNKPIDGANDGGSGVGVILEMARQFSIKEPTVGIDVIFFDAEDYGRFIGSMKNGSDEGWCLGSQYWGRNQPIANFRPRYGILLDMVGEKNAKFPKESYSMLYAQNIVEKVWNTARKLGYSNYFVNKVSGGITDDHVFVNQLANIPSIDIISHNTTGKTFGEYHHTHDDNMEGIDKNSLKAVGQTVMEVVYQEK